MKVSVIIITYNHEKYLRNTLESAINQKVNFEYEIIISDDASTDTTPAIINEFHERYPNLIVPLLHNKNLGGFGKNNTLAALAVTKGTYIAALDGDDYWTDSEKLQTQVDYLENNPSFSACFHNAKIKYEDDLEVVEEFVNDENQKMVVSKADLIDEDEVWFIATSAFMFKNGILKNYPKWFHESKSGDIPRYVLLAKAGDIGYINKVMSVYRKNRMGMSFTDSKFNANYIRNRISMFKAIDKEYNFEFHQKMRFTLAKYYLFLARCSDLELKFLLKPCYAIVSLYHSKPNTSAHLKEIISDEILPKSFLKIYANTKWFFQKKISTISKD